MKKILFITPRMVKYGSEYSLFWILRRLTKYRAILLSGQKGELIRRLPPQIKVYIDPLQRPIDYYINFLCKKILKTTISEVYLEKIIRKEKPDACVLNTIITLKWIPVIKKYDVPVGVFVHELYSAYEHIPSRDLNLLMDETEFVICPSIETCERLRQAGYNKKIFLFQEPIDTDDISFDSSYFLDLRNKYDFILGMSGVFCNFKGARLVTKIASYLKQRNIALIWLGKILDTGLTALIMRQIKNLRLDNFVLIGEKDGKEYYSILNQIDGMLFTSIEDTYPIAVLEALYLQKPVITFNSGGVSEMIKEGMGRVVPLYDFDALFQAIDDLVNNRIKINRELMRNFALHHDIKSRIQTFEAILQEGFA